MSRIGKKSVAIPSGVTITVTNSTVTVKGPKGELHYTHNPEVRVVIDGSTLTVEVAQENERSRAFHGLARQLISNMIIGVSAGFTKRLEIIGVGYKAAVQGRKLVLNLGHSHPIDFAIPDGIEITPDEKNKNILNVSGIDKQKVGQVSSVIRGFRPPEPYKGKGVRYTDEFVRRKAGKTAAK